MVNARQLTAVGHIAGGKTAITPVKRMNAVLFKRVRSDGEQGRIYGIATDILSIMTLIALVSESERSLSGS